MNAETVGLNRWRNTSEDSRFEMIELDKQLYKSQEKYQKCWEEKNELTKENHRLYTLNQDLEQKIEHQGKELKGQVDKVLQANAAVKSASDRVQLFQAQCTNFKKQVEERERTIVSLNAKVKSYKHKMVEVQNEKERVVKQTREDAKRIRELWSATMTKHREQQQFFDESTRKFNEQKINHLEELAEKNTQIKLYKKKNEDIKNNIGHLENRCSEMSNEIEKLKVLETLTREKLQAQVLKCEKIQSRLELMGQQYKTLAAEHSRTVQNLKECQTQLADQTQEAGCIQEEYVALIDKHEDTMRDLRDEADVIRQSEDVMRKKLADGTRCAEDVVQELIYQIGEHDYLLGFVNRKLSDIQSNSRKVKSPFVITKPLFEETCPVESETRDTMSIFDQFKN